MKHIYLKICLVIVALFGGGVVTAVCFHSWLGALPCWSALKQWMCKKRVICCVVDNEEPMASIVL